MRLHVRVRHSHALGGYRQDKSKLNIVEGEYEVEIGKAIYHPRNGPEVVLVFKGADQATGGDPTVSI
jgi:hypothetical protein